MKKGGLFFAKGADTCVYDPPVDCKPGTQSPARIPAGDYVSRLVVKSDSEVNNQIAVRKAVGQLQSKYPGADIASHFNLAVAMCEPQLKESDLKNAQGKYCSARQRVIDNVNKGPTYANLITPRQEKDMYDQPTDFNRAKLPALLHAIVYLNSANIVHSDAHSHNIAKMGDKLVLHDWGRVIVGLSQFKMRMGELLYDPSERAHLQRYAQWKFPCELLDMCIVPDSDDATFLRFMRMYDILSILGSIEGLKIVDQVKIQTVLHICSNLLFSDIDPKDMMPYLHAVIDVLFTNGPLPAILEPYKPTSPIVVAPPPAPRQQVGTMVAESSISSAMPSSPPQVRRNVPRLVLPRQPSFHPVGQTAPAQQSRQGRVASGEPSWGSARAPKKTAKKLCTCIKAVRKTIKARPGISKEKGAIAICVKSVVQTKRSTLKRFKCGKKPRLITQKRIRGGATVIPDELKWERSLQAYNHDAVPYDRDIWGAVKVSTLRYLNTNPNARAFLAMSLLLANPELIEIMYQKGARYADFINEIDGLRSQYGTEYENQLMTSKQIIQKYQS